MMSIFFGKCPTFFTVHCINNSKKNKIKCVYKIFKNEYVHYLLIIC